MRRGKLYNIEKRLQPRADDLAAKNPEKLKQLQAPLRRRGEEV